MASTRDTRIKTDQIGTEFTCPAIAKANEKTGNRTENITLLTMTKHELIIDN